MLFIIQCFPGVVTSRRHMIESLIYEESSNPFIFFSYGQFNFFNLIQF